MPRSVLILLLLTPLRLYAVFGTASTATTLSVTPGTSVSRATLLTLQATIAAGPRALQHGSVTFYDGSAPLATVQVVYSGSTYTLGTASHHLYLGPGTHVLRALYSGSAMDWPSASSIAIVVVSAPPRGATSTTFTATGDPGSYALSGTVNALGGLLPTGNIAFADLDNNNFPVATAALDPATFAATWPTFTPNATAATSYGILLADLNADGIPDLVTSNYGGASLSVLLGNGDGTFQNHIDYAAPSLPFGLAVGDFNGDGIPDLVVASHNSTIVGVLLGNGNGTFQSAHTYASSGIPQYPVVGDLDGDGILDVATCSTNGSAITLLLGNGDGTLQAPNAFATAGFCYGLVAADLNADGVTDLVFSDNNNGLIGVILGNGGGTFQSQVTYAVTPNPTTLAAADFNGDGKLDLVVGSLGTSSLTVLLGNGDGSFQSGVAYTGFLNPWGVAVADVNQDGIPDILAASPTAKAVEYFLGQGDGTFAAPVTTATGSTNYLLAAGDLNGDGALDLAVPNLASATLRVALLSLTETATAIGVSIPGAGTHNLVASYVGDADYAPSTSSSISLGASPLATSLTLTLSPSSNSAHVLTAELNPIALDGYSPTGAIAFSDDGITLATVALFNGVATLAKNFSVGSHHFSATFRGDAIFLPASSNSVSKTLLPTDFTITPSPAALTVPRGSQGASLLTVAPTGGFTGQLTFACSGLPKFASCAFAPATLTLPGDDTPQKVHFSLLTSAASTSPSSPSPLSAFLLPLALVTVLARKRGPLGRALVLLAVVGALPACGRPSHQVPLGTSMLIMTATSTTGTPHSATISITITR